MTRSGKVPDQPSHSGSWIVVSRKTGLAVFETYNRKTAEAVNQKAYEVLTAADYLARLNKSVKNPMKKVSRLSKLRAVIFATRGRQTAYWAGTTFDSRRDLAKEYADEATAVGKAKELARWCQPGWIIKVSVATKLTRRKNPLPASRLASAEKLYRNFHGEHPTRVTKLDIPAIKGPLLTVGPLEGVIYGTRRDGKRIHALHEIAPGARPTLHVSHNGRQIVVTGGAVRFTDRGFVDGKPSRSSKVNRHGKSPRHQSVRSA